VAGRNRSCNGPELVCVAVVLTHDACIGPAFVSQRGPQPKAGQREPSAQDNVVNQKFDVKNELL